MKLAGMSFFQLASQRMNWLSARQAVISENIANVDTPNFRSRDVSGFDRMVQAQAPAQGLAVTNARHIRTETATPEGIRIEADEIAGEPSIDGNSVVLEQQTINAAEVAGSYRLAAQLYRKGHELLTVAVTGVR